MARYAKDCVSILSVVRLLTRAATVCGNGDFGTSPIFGHDDKQRAPGCLQNSQGSLRGRSRCLFFWGALPPESGLTDHSGYVPK
jgi:hypothetical protein